ncbi:phosphoribosyl-ATP diphosphatase [Varunaivibrio sulfuroxidans]|uniref:Phosphoribosyl-ATP pyrophosphatase n=1 Tax=Varunaivibrio sulfuroxidans TaxID=1773489 RepID=A0A4R3JFH2_9PROT|nr:phosphoribosyl-ATP diphosphatase [Varunaivibrio sulfuroxidans]TCS64889.1 phosphoribosyl-ATP pyrophosphatase [Varunaivibrio sulfuroxidans]WES29816.1 phosphoribosyl-ATP diphosphatase [Varunaivibrio sulfuroxidans]
MTTSPRDARILDGLFETVLSRRGGDASASWTAKLFAKGRPAIAQKVGEEAVETVIAAIAEKPENLTAESADLLYHLLVLWADAGIAPGDVWAELARREGVSGVAEKNARPKRHDGEESKDDI